MVSQILVNHLRKRESYIIMLAEKDATSHKAFVEYFEHVINYNIIDVACCCSTSILFKSTYTKY